MSSPGNGKVLIIGAGLGGLALAQMLDEHGIPFEIFERDDTTSSRKQGWAVVLRECLPAFERLINPSVAENMHANSVNHGTGDHDEIGFVDSIKGTKIGSSGGVPHGQDGYMLRVSRENLRTYLWKSHNLPVESGKHYTHYTEDADGVTAFFKDGSSARGSLLVGADGLHSHVLDQLVGDSHHKPVLSQYVPIFGEVELPRALYEPQRELGKSAILTAAPGVRQQIGMLHMSEDESHAAYFWALMLWREDPKPLSDWIQKATRQEIYDFALESTNHLHPVVTDLMRFGGPDAIAQPQPKFLEFVPPNELPTGRVTVLGDAAHSMIPFRGAGANTAILDACDLAMLLIDRVKAKEDFAGVIPTYHKLMIPRGQEVVLSSRAAGQGQEDPAATWAKMFQRK